MIKLLYYLFITGFSLIAGFSSFAQDTCNADVFFQKNTICPDSKKEKKCYQIDMSNSIDPEGKKLTYQWNFGDGSVKKGVLVTHCYQNYGTYYVTLDLLDNENNIVIENEWSTKLIAHPAPKRLPYTLYSDIKTTFQYDKKQFPNCYTYDIFWKIEDKFYCGKKYEHTFEKEGLYWVEMGLLGTLENGSILTGYTIVQVLVKSNK